MEHDATFYALVMAGVVGFVVLFFAPLVIALKLIAHFERRAAEKLRATGARCTAYVKTFRRVSMTQHRVLFEIHHPQGAMGREYMLSGLDDVWLADVCALQRPVAVIADPAAKTVVFA